MKVTLNNLSGILSVIHLSRRKQS